jgi:hypothetical protein
MATFRTCRRYSTACSLNQTDTEVWGATGCSSFVAGGKQVLIPETWGGLKPKEVAQPLDSRDHKTKGDFSHSTEPPAPKRYHSVPSEK